ncbi:hypothetical protein JR316_0011234 [Psilocybe cubensis]|uniref:Uncharacterized protein n=2 Tax=Psilocybe cubensis TaxID=181762 RepID=A0ACB8GIX1_PSICU|nr:hypothetical protein JR316_0011234 [Psilocybe cubensis]KAH9475675.1 hypothetical protein JR316_0011234 [Psilocybe cubensis]
MEDIKKNAFSECQWCMFILTLIQEDTRRSGSGTLDIIMGIRPQNGYLGSPKNTQALCIYINNFLSFEGFLYADADSPSAEYITARSRIIEVGSSQALSLCKKHLDECVRSHKRCSPRVDPCPPLPTRVIDCSDANNPRLVETTNLEGSYCTLSYVWGEAQPHSTNKNNIKAYTDKIDTTRLPKTILNAIHTTTALGLRYLWIDSLCIIQDSEDDKLLEIARMGHIYRNAYVTIIAASAQRVSTGFLEPRPPVPPAQFPRDISMPFPCFPEEEGNRTPFTLGTVRMSPTSFYAESEDTFDKWSDYFPGMEPVNERAWCLQEYAMSPRALVFASHTVQFHCRTGGAQNVGGSYGDHPDRENLLPASFFAQEGSKDVKTVTRGSPAWVSARFAWHSAVEGYTRRALTKPEDKFVAFAGVAEAFQPVWGGVYLAGLWQDTLLSDLLWSKFADMDMPRPKVYRAPSWSWASIDGSIIPGKLYDKELHEGDTLASVIDCKVELKYSEHPFGEVNRGVLVLRAPLEECRWDIQNSKLLYHKRDSKEGFEQKWIGTGSIDSEDDQDIHDVFAISIYRKNAEVEGIILAKLSKNSLEPNNKTKYRRIGYFDSHGMGGTASWLDSAQVEEVIVV